MVYIMVHAKTHTRPSDDVPPASVSPAASSTAPSHRGRRRSVEKHRTILSTAIDLVQTRGYAAVTMEAIAAAAGVGKMTLYRWWTSKPALMLEAYVDLMRAEALACETGDPVEDIRHLATETVRVLRHTPAGLMLAGLIADAQHDSAARDAVNGGLVAGRREIVVAPMIRAAEAGRLSPAFDPDYAADFLVGMIWQRLLTDTLDSDPDLADRLVATLCPGANP